MAMTVYGLDWVNGDGLNYAYTNLADAKLDVFEYLLNSYINNISTYNLTIGDVENYADELALDSKSLMVDEWIDDLVYITYLNVSDKFTPSA